MENRTLKLSLAAILLSGTSLMASGIYDLDDVIKAKSYKSYYKNDDRDDNDYDHDKDDHDHDKDDYDDQYEDSEEHSQGNEKLESFIERFYSNILERESEEEGMRYWENELSSKKISSQDIVRAFFHSEEFFNKDLNESEFIDTVYKTIMGREADEGGYEYWSDKLETDEIDRDDLLDQFIDSKEFQELKKEYNVD